MEIETARLRPDHTGDSIKRCSYDPAVTLTLRKWNDPCRASEKEEKKFKLQRNRVMERMQFISKV
jgi:hypothetical protein